MIGDAAAVLGGIVLAFVAWGFMFRLDRRDIWPRTWVAAAALAAYTAVARTLLGDVRTMLGSLSVLEVGIGATVGVLWVFVTRLGAGFLRRVAPSFADQTLDLYRLAQGSRVAHIAGPLIAMAAAEEMLFRGLIQGRVGLVAGLLVYSAVQLVEGKWLLVLAAALGALVWGGVVEWRHGLLAATVAHVVWTLTLTVFWPLSEPLRRHGDADGKSASVRSLGRTPT